MALLGSVSSQSYKGNSVGSSPLIYYRRLAIGCISPIIQTSLSYTLIYIVSSPVSRVELHMCGGRKLWFHSLTPRSATPTHTSNSFFRHRPKSATPCSTPPKISDTFSDTAPNQRPLVRHRLKTATRCSIHLKSATYCSTPP